MKRFFAATLFSLALSSGFAQADTLKWAWEDDNGDGFWNYSVVNWNFRSANQWNNFSVSSDAYEGRSSLRFEYLNQDRNEGGGFVQAFGFALIPTSAAGNGTDPSSGGEYDRGRDLRGYDALEFYIKGTPGANQSAFNIWLRSPDGHGSVQVPINRYVHVTDNWQKVSIPMSEFSGVPAYGFQLSNVHVVGFYVNQNNNNTPFEFNVDNLSFVNRSSDSAMPAIRPWWSKDPNYNGAYNYSTTYMQGGSTVNVANQWNDVVTGSIMTGPGGQYLVEVVDLEFYHSGRGYAEANLTTSPANTGYEATNEWERDAGKPIASNQASLKFATANLVAGVKVKLVDSAGRSSRALNINNYLLNTGPYAQNYSIPTSAFAEGAFDFNSVKSVTYLVDGSVPQGNYGLKIFTLFFQKD
ncbi:MAG: hypothetical protein EOP09_03335 [Proteobacteria bacterium]|nr:MAG: hypothetical protein EOP09_03335 [Pseudomonadota bacterium]